jgi:hypothetical protein
MHHTYRIAALGIASLAIAAIASTGRVDVHVASAPANINEQDLGRFFDTELRPMEARVTFTPRRIASGETQRVLQKVRTELELRANASAWGLLGAAASFDRATTHAYFRAIQIDEIVEAAQPRFPSALPAGAAYYISEVHLGRMYEVHFTGTDSAVSAAIGATTGKFGGGLSAWAAEHRVEFRARTVGLTPKLDAAGAIFASSSSEIAQNYEVGGPPRAILYKLSEVPGRAKAAPPNRWNVTLVEVQFPPLKPNRQAWDFGTPPDPWVIVKGAATWDGWRNDTYQATFNQALGALALSAHNPLVIEVWERDLSSHDSAGSLRINGPEGGESANGLTWFITDHGVKVGLRFTPAP